MIGIESWGIGIGKTELTRALAARVPNSTAYFEKVYNVHFQPFYEDVRNGVKPSVHASRMQWFCMGDRYWNHREAQASEWRTWDQTIHDRTIIGDHAFALKLYNDGFLSKSDYDLYLSHRRTMEAQIMPHQIVIRLEGTPEICLSRLRKRIAVETGRECEKDTVNVEYLLGLKKAYEEVVWPWFEEKGSHIITYDWSGENFQENIEKILRDIGKIIPGFRFADSAP